MEASRSLARAPAASWRRGASNLVAPIVVYATLIIPANILFEAYLSYLGAGIPQSIPSWGRMLSEASDIFDIAPWFMFFPGLFLLLTTLSFNLLGDGLRGALDPKVGAVKEAHGRRPDEAVRMRLERLVMTVG